MTDTNKRASASPQHRAHSGEPRLLRVLIADDERDTVSTLMMILEDEGHEVEGVYSGSRVLPLIRQFDPDVVLLDIALPRCSLR